jgi:putative peptidoglycan lipid II flippase
MVEKPLTEQGKAAPSGIMRGAAFASLGVMFSRVFGLLRETLFAMLFGASREYDAFLMAFRIPNLLRDLFAEGALSQAFTKVFSQTAKNDGDDAAWRAANKVLTLLALVLTVITVAGMFLADEVVGLLAPGFSGIPGKRELTTQLTVWMFPFIVMVALAAAVMGMLNSKGRTGLPQAASAFFNVGSIVCGLGVAWWLAPDFIEGGLALVFRREHAAAVEGGQAARAMVGMAVGVLAGGALQLLVQLPALWKLGWRPRFSLDIKDAKVREVFVLMGPAVLGAAAVQVNIFINSNFASHLGDRPVSWLNYAFRFMQFPIGIFGVAIASAALPEFSRATANKLAPDMDGLRHAIRGSVALACLLCVPAAVGLGVLGEPLIGLIYEHGRFSAADTLATAAALQAYSVGLTGYAAIKVLQPALLALNDAKTPMWIAVGSMALNLVVNHVLVNLLGFGHVGLAMTTSTTALINALLLALVLRRRAGGMEGGKLLLSLMKIGVSAAVMGAAVWGVSTLLAHVMERGFLLHAVRLGAGVATGVVVFGVVVAVLRVEELQLLLGMVRRRVKR